MADMTMPARRDGYELDTDPGRLDASRVYEWISTDAYWALGRTRETMDRAIEGSLCFGVYATGGEQVAFARIVTDHATFAWLCDVYVAREARGAGIGTWLVGSIREYLTGLGVLRVVLSTQDAHGVYAKVGFTPFGHPQRWMEVDLRPSSPAGDVEHT